MLLATSSSNHHLMVGIRPRAVTAPVRLRSLSGTRAKMSTRREDFSLTPASAGLSTRMSHVAGKKVHWPSTVRVPGPRANLALEAAAGGLCWPKARFYSVRGPAKRSVVSPTVFQKSSVTPPVSTETVTVRTPVVQPPAPQVVAPPRPESPLAHARRSAGPNNVPPVRIVSSNSIHTLSIALPRPGGAPLAPEMITVSARRGGRLAVVADAWHLENDCHYEWHVAFPQREVDLGAVRARFGEDGTLIIDVPRRPPRSGTRFV